MEDLKEKMFNKEQESVIIDLCNKLTTLNCAMSEMTASWKDATGMSQEEMQQKENERIVRSINVFGNFISFYQDNLKSLPEAIIEKIDVIKEAFYKSFGDYTFGKQFDIESKFTLELVVEAGNKVRNIQPAIAQLLNDFRSVSEQDQ